MKMLKSDDTTLDEIIRNLGRSKKSVDQDIKTVEKWTKEQPHLPKIIDARFVQNFLLINKFSIETTKQKIDAYCTVRTHMIDIFGKINPKNPEMKKLTDMVYFVPHPQLFEHNRVFFFMIRNKNLAEDLDPYDVVRYAIGLNEIRARKDVMNGDIFVVDCNRVPLSYVLKLTPTFIFKTIGVLWKKVYTFQIKGFYVINLPSFGEKLVPVFKKIMKPKIFERVRHNKKKQTNISVKIHFLTDCNDLKKYLPVDFLPREFGGKNKSLDVWQDMVNEEMRSHQDLFDLLQEAKVDETLRPESLKNDDFLGCYGAFKRLEVD